MLALGAEDAALSAGAQLAPDVARGDRRGERQAELQRPMRAMRRQRGDG